MKYQKNEDGTDKLDAAGNKIPVVEVVVDPPAEARESETPVPDDGEVDESKLDEKTRKYIQGLRKESAGYRTKHKTSEGNLAQVKKLLGLDPADSMSAEQKIAALQGQSEAQQFQSAVLQNAVEHGVGKESLKYFSFLLTEAREGLADGEELAEDAIKAAALEAKAKAVKPKATSSVNPQVGGATTPVAGDGSLTVEAFATMTVSEKSKVFTEQPELYERLWKQATEKNLIK